MGGPTAELRSRFRLTATTYVFFSYIFSFSPLPEEEGVLRRGGGLGTGKGSQKKTKKKENTKNEEKEEKKNIRDLNDEY